MENLKKPVSYSYLQKSTLFKSELFLDEEILNNHENWTN